MMTSPGLLLYTTYRLAPGNVDAFSSLASRMRTAATARAGCAFLDVAQDIGDPTTFRMVEGWRDRADLDAHLASEEFRAVLDDAGALDIVDRHADAYAVTGRTALDMP